MSKDAIYITRGVKHYIPLEIIMCMLKMIKGIQDKDYLQVLNVQMEYGYSRIKLTQEVPAYEKSIKVRWQAEQNLKLFYIDNVLMLAEEY